MTGFGHASDETLKTLQGNLLAGLDAVAATVAAGTFYTPGPKGSAPPAQSGHLTLALLNGVNAELGRRGFRQAYEAVGHKNQDRIDEEQCDG